MLVENRGYRLISCLGLAVRWGRSPKFFALRGVTLWAHIWLLNEINEALKKLVYKIIFDLAEVILIVIK